MVQHFGIKSFKKYETRKQIFHNQLYFTFEYFFYATLQKVFYNPLMFNKIQTHKSLKDTCTKRRIEVLNIK